MTKSKKLSLIGSALLLLIASAPLSQAETFGSVTHIHNVRAFGNQVILGTHEGLYLFQGKDKMKKMSSENFDVMGLAVWENIIYASGHPGPGSKLPEPVGLLVSNNKGGQWKKVSLQGKVDFHLLEASKKEIYGGDSQSGKLMYSSNSGKTWKTIKDNQYSDIAINSEKMGEAFAIKQGALFKTSNSFKSEKAVKTDFKINSIEFYDDKLYAAAGKSIYISQDAGKTWRKISTLKSEISIISISSTILAAAAGSNIYISKDLGKSFT